MEKSDPKLDNVNSLWFLSMGVTAMAGSILIYVLIIESALGAFAIKDTLPNNIISSKSSKVAILNSQHTRTAYMKTNPENPNVSWVDGVVASWSSFLSSRGRAVEFDQIDDQKLENDDMSDYQVLVLPSSLGLSDQQIQNIKAFMDRGGSVMATWMPGTLDEKGNWRGWSFISEAFGVEFTGYKVQQRQGQFRTSQITVPGFTPPGLYRPLHYVQNDTSYNASSSTKSSSDNAGPLSLHDRERAQANRAKVDFPQLRGYEWMDTLSAKRPQMDFASAETLMAQLPDLQAGGRIRQQQAVRITYYTWLGRNQDNKIPFPYTNPGIERITFIGDTPLTARIPSGYRVKVQTYNRGVKMKVVEPRSHAAGFWYDFAVEEAASVGEAAENSTSMVFGTYGKGRFVYLGFQRDALGIGSDDTEDSEQLGQMFANMMAYLQRRPIIWVHEWPGQHAAGAVISGVANNDASIPNFNIVADYLEREGVPGSYFVRPEFAAQHAQLLQRLCRNGDVGVLDDLLRGTDGAKDFQEDRIDNLKSILDNLLDVDNTGCEAVGYRPTKRGMMSKVTMNALMQADYTYFEADSIGRKLSPKVMGRPFQQLIRIGYTARSDKELFEDMATKSTRAWRALFREDISRVLKEKSMYHLVYNADLLVADPVWRPVFPAIIRDLKDRDFWISSGKEMADWHRKWMALTADVEQRGASRIFVRISSSYPDVVENLSVYISLGHAASAVSIRPELVKLTPEDVFTPKLPDPLFTQGGTVLILPIDKLEPQQYRIYNIDLLDAEKNPLADNN